RGPRFTQPDYAMQAAMEGTGVVLGWRSLAQADIDAGRLLIPFDLPLQLYVAFYLVYPEASAERPKLTRFREWLLGQTVASLGARDRKRTSPVLRAQHRGTRRPTRRSGGGRGDRD